MRRKRNALMASMYGDDDPGEMPPDGFVEGEEGPPNQYVPLDEMSRNALMPNQYVPLDETSRNALMPNVQLVADRQKPATQATDPQSQQLAVRGQMMQLLRQQPSPQTQNQVRAIFEEAKRNPNYHTDDLLVGMEHLSRKFDVPLPFQP
jgi:hypothetical protein